MYWNKPQQVKVNNPNVPKKTLSASCLVAACASGKTPGSFVDFYWVWWVLHPPLKTNHLTSNMATWRIGPHDLSVNYHDDRKSAIVGVVPLPNGLFMACKWGLRTTYKSWHDPPSMPIFQNPNIHLAILRVRDPFWDGEFMWPFKWFMLTSNVWGSKGHVEWKVTNFSRRCIFEWVFFYCHLYIWGLDPLKLEFSPLKKKWIIGRGSFPLQPKFRGELASCSFFGRVPKRSWDVKFA